MCSCRHKCARSGVTIIPSSRSALNAPHGNTGQQGDACDGARGVPAGATGEEKIQWSVSMPKAVRKTA